MDKKISCIIPAYNEEKYIGGVVRATLKAKANGLLSEIIVISDGSHDNTAKKAKSAGADLVIDLKENKGKANAVYAGLDKAKNKSILMLDADLVGLKNHHFEELIKTGENADLVIGYFEEDVRQNIAPQLSGQRFMNEKMTELFLQSRQRIAESRYGIEILMNRQANKEDLKTLMVPLRGILHITKTKKYGIGRALWQKLHFSLAMTNVYRKLLLSILALVVIIAIVALILWLPIFNNP